LLVLVLYAENPEHAGNVARTIIEELPYELLVTQCSIRNPTDLSAKCAGALKQGRELGLGMILFAMETGDDESRFEAMEFP
jgi:hypothetical protein